MKIKYIGKLESKKYCIAYFLYLIVNLPNLQYAVDFKLLNLQEVLLQKLAKIDTFSIIYVGLFISNI